MVFVLVPDTNVLYTNNKIDIVSQEFSNLILKFKDTFNIRLLIPEVVRGELLYQKFYNTKFEFSKAKDSLKNINLLTGSTLELPVDESDLKINLNKKFDDWLKLVNGTIENTPTTNINWQDIINESIWREGVFLDQMGKDNEDKIENNDSNKKKLKRECEKGFRDSLIQQTFLGLVKSFNGNEEIYFITGDDLLREDTIRKEDKIDNINFVKSVAEMETLFNFKNLKIANALVEKIIGHAEKGFAEYFQEENIIRKNDREFSKYITPSLQLEKEYKFSDGSIAPSRTGNLSQIGEPEYDLTKPKFIEKDGNIYKWESALKLIVTYGSSFNNPHVSYAVIGGIYKIEYKFQVKWSSEIGEDNKLFNYKIENINYIEKEIFDTNYIVPGYKDFY